MPPLRVLSRQMSPFSSSPVVLLLLASTAPGSPSHIYVYNCLCVLLLPCSATDTSLGYFTFIFPFPSQVFPLRYNIYTALFRLSSPRCLRKNTPFLGILRVFPFFESADPLFFLSLSGGFASRRLFVLFMAFYRRIIRRGVAGCVLPALHGAGAAAAVIGGGAKKSLLLFPRYLLFLTVCSAQTKWRLVVSAPLIRGRAAGGEGEGWRYSDIRRVV